MCICIVRFVVSPSHSRITFVSLRCPYALFVSPNLEMTRLHRCAMVWLGCIQVCAKGDSGIECLCWTLWFYRRYWHTKMRHEDTGEWV